MRRYYGSQQRQQKQAPAPATQSIPEIVVGTPRFSTLLAALKAADLVGALSGDGPFTVFAPNNDAFAKIPADTLNGLLADKDALTAVLTQHVVSGKIFAADVGSPSVVQSLNPNEMLKAYRYGYTVKVKKAMNAQTKAKVVNADINATNGVIHE